MVWAVTAAAPKKDDPPLPALRDELRLLERKGGTSERTTYVIHDPVQNRYFELERDSFQLLSLWTRSRTAGGLAQNAVAVYDLTVPDDTIASLARFLAVNHLTTGGDTAWKTFFGINEKAKHGWLMWAVHNYLFIRLPLFKPDSFLRRVYPWITPLYSRAFFAIVALMGTVGLYLAARQWETFTHTFLHFFSFDGALYYIASLAIVKSLHELGHAFTAVRYGCRVPTMGVCFMVLMPMLYSDVSDAWKLQNRKQRMAIDAAGVIVELALAAIALFLWVFLPDGALRSIAFTTATTSVAISLALNISPFMRFDGYYLLSDAWGIPNLQARSFAIGRWMLREALFDLGRPPPDAFSRQRRLGLAAYAYAVWIYRLVLFTGIAILVYNASFKALGIILFAIEIIFFIAKPIISEAKEWWTMRDDIIENRRGLWGAGAVVFALLLSIIPLPVRIEVPAIQEAAAISRLYPARAGKITEIRLADGGKVEAGDVLVVLSAPDLELQVSVARNQLSLVQKRLRRRAGDVLDKSASMVLESEQQTLISRLSGLERERALLTIKAPIDGIIAEISSGLRIGQWVGRTEQLALIRGEGDLVARGYVSERELSRLKPSAPGRFIPSNPLMSTSAVELIEISESGAPSIAILDLASAHGGPIAVTEDGSSGAHAMLVPSSAYYFLSARLKEVRPEAEGKTEPGVILFKGEPQSLAKRALSRIFSVLIRESGA